VIALSYSCSNICISFSTFFNFSNCGGVFNNSFNSFLIETNVRVILSSISILTIFISGVMANFENNFKKIIALSTLRRLELIIITLRFRFRIIAYYHLLVHAIFKSILFMAARAVIHLIKNTQDIRLLGNLNEVIPYVIIRLLISRMALRGMPFMSGFYRKDVIIEIIYGRKGLNIFMFVLIIIV